jgi:hypothetical protein
MNGQEKDVEIFKGAYGAKFWEYDSRIGRRWNLDPVLKEWESPYACFSGNPIVNSDPNGDDWGDVIAGALIGAVTSIVPGTTSLREQYHPRDAVDYNNTLKGVDNAAAVAGTGLMGIGGGEVITGGVIATTGVGSPVGGVVAAEGAVVAGAGAVLNANANANKKAGYNYGDEKTHQTYTKKNEKTGEVYSGKTSGKGTPEENVAKRDSRPDHQAKNKDGYGPAKLDKSSKDPNAIRGREQQNIDKNGGAKSKGGTSGNKINSVGDKNPNKAKYEKAANREFKN